MGPDFAAPTNECSHLNLKTGEVFSPPAMTTARMYGAMARIDHQRGVWITGGIDFSGKHYRYCQQPLCHVMHAEAQREHLQYVIETNDNLDRIS